MFWKICSLVVSLPVLAQSTPQQNEIRPMASILGRDDAAFARALYEDGLFDLAEGVCAAILAGEEAGQADFYQVLDAKALMLELRIERVRAEEDLIRRKDEIQAILAEKNQLIDDNSRTEVAEALRNTLPDTYMLLGATLAAALKKEQDPSVGAKLRAEGDASFKKAEEEGRQRIKRMAEQKDAGGPRASYAERQHMIATYNLAKIQYFHGLLFPEGDPEQAKYFEAAIDQFSDFSLDYPETLLTYEGYIFQGLCHRDLGDVEAALEDFDAAIELRETWDQDETTGKWPTSEDAANVISVAVLQKVELLAEQGRHDEADATARDFYDTIPDALLASRGLETLSAHAESRLAAGDVEGARELAQRLVDNDPQGGYGARGRGLLGQLLGAGGARATPDQMINIAQTLRDRGDLEGTLDLCRKVLSATRAKAEFASAGAQACVLMGGLYASRNQLYEASLAYDLAPELYPRGDLTPEAVWRAVESYRRLYRDEKRPFFDKRMQERVRTLVNDYSSHPRAAWATTIEGSQFEDAREFLKAAKLYLAIPPGSTVYEEAESRAGICYYQEARAEQKKGNASEADKHFKEAERLLRKTLVDIDAASEKTLDSVVQAQLAATRFGAQVNLARLLLETGRAPEVGPLLQDIEKRYPGDGDKVEAVWVLRIEALGAEGKLEEAVALFESLLQTSANPSGTAKAAGVLARNLDASALALQEKDPKSAQARELWAKAVHYYDLSIQPQLKGQIISASDVQTVADRLYSLGLILNDVPEGVETFVDWTDKPKAPQIWELAATVYDRLLAQAPSYRSMIHLGRCYGLLGRWADAASVYARLFDTEPILEPGGSRFDQQVLRAKPDLRQAYLEWGVAEHMLALAEQSQDSFTRASEIFQKMVHPTNTSSSERIWWQSKYWQARSLYDRGEYESARFVIRDVKRGTAEDFDKGEFGYREKFAALEAEVSKKVFNTR